MTEDMRVLRPSRPSPRAGGGSPLFPCVLAVLGTLAASTSNPQEPFRVETDVVLLDVSVTEPDGRPVLGLTADDFVVREDGVPREITFFRAFSETRPTPLSAVLVIDASSSMQGSALQDARDAALSFIGESSDNTEIAIVSFDREPHVLTGFTRDRDALASAVEELRASGGTALYDAVLEADGLFRDARNRRRAIVLETDGCDLDSRARFDELERVLAASEGSLYAVGPYGESMRNVYLSEGKYFKPPSFEENLNPVWVLRRLAEVTGGRAAFPHPGESVAPLFEQIARGLRHQYLLGFAPGGPEEDDPRFRKLELDLRNGTQGASSYVVRTRRGYVR